MVTVGFVDGAARLPTMICLITNLVITKHD